jgi:hypothetical protein
MKTHKKPLTLDRETLRHISGGQLAPPIGPLTATLRTVVTIATCPQATNDTECNCA